MKPQFSILTVLCLTLYAAVALMGAVNPLSVWGFAIIPIWLGATMWFIHCTAQGASARGEFAKAFVITSTVLVVLEMFSGLPRGLARQTLESLGVIDRQEVGDVVTRYQELLKAHMGLWIAILAGLVAAWRYQVEARQSVTEEASP